MAKSLGLDEESLKKITCRSCGHKIAYAPGEVRNLWSGTDYGGGPDGANGFTCPNCGNDIITKRW